MHTRRTTITAAVTAAALAVTIAGFGLVNASNTSGNTFTAITPCRLVDTRADSTVGDRVTPLGADESVTFTATGDNGECTDVAPTAEAIRVHVTAVGATEESYFTLVDGDVVDLPLIAQLNFGPTVEITSNSTTVTLADDGSYQVYNRNGTVDLVIDLLGYYEPGDVGAGPAGPVGPTGPEGPEGPTGPATPATYSNPEWGVMLRNTIGTATAQLRGGPTSTAFVSLGATPQAPPYGEGSLQLLVPTGDDKVDFGNEVDFVGDEVTAITEIGFHWFATGESNALATTNVPAIRLEINPNGAGTHPPTDAYASLVFVPDAEAADNEWTDYVDATDDAAGTWFLTGAPAADDCRPAAPCVWSDLQTYLGTATAAPTIYTVAVGKGRDTGFQGAIDGLRVNDTIYDFEPLGVVETAAP